MKPKVLRSVRSKDSDGHKGNYVELLKDGETYIVRHKLSTMQKHPNVNTKQVHAH